ncbi:MAG: EAL domain-containing protein [Planctomycetes bacterium]|nr:EAL domain-containing protein [Planctomycetota bacterium]
MTGTRLLVVSDDQDVVRVYSRLASKRGFECVVASSCDEVVQATSSVRLALVVLDHDHDEVDSLDVIEALAEHRCLAPVQLVGSRDPRNLRAASRVGDKNGLRMTRIVRKPLDERSVLRATQNVLPILNLVITREAIEHAIAHDEFVLHYQPLVNMRSGHVCTAEALVRWDHPDYGRLDPGRFIPEVESTGMIGRLTMWVVRNALHQYRVWEDEGWSFEIAVNVAAEELRERTFVDEMLAAVHEAGVSPRRLVLEITESQTIADETEVLATLVRLSKRGFQLAIDDFGTGYSSLGRLHKIPFDKLKIDKSFVMDAVDEDDADAKRLVRFVSELGRSQRMTVVAEGVSTREAWNLVASLGCDVAQGYFLSPPLPAEQFSAWLYENNVQTHVPGQAGPLPAENALPGPQAEARTDESEDDSADPEPNDASLAPRTTSDAGTQVPLGTNGHGAPSPASTPNPVAPKHADVHHPAPQAKRQADPMR